MWLKPHLEEACRVMAARVAAVSNYRKKCKKPEKLVLAGDSIPLCATVPHLHLHPWKGKHEVRHEFLYLPDCPVALMGRDLCTLRAQVAFDFDGTASLMLRGPEAKILTLMVVQKEEW
jgi:hypothetical protein